MAVRVAASEEEGVLGRVLAAVDLTPLGRRVADRARLVAEILAAELQLLHAIEPLSEVFVGPELAELIRRHRTEAAEELGEWCRRRTDRPVTVSIVKGSPTWEIVRAAKSAELTVVGSSTLDVTGTGPVTARVAETSRGSVLVVRRQPRAPYRRVVVAVDMSKASARAVDLALTLAPDAETTAVFALPTRFDTYLADAGMFPEEIDLSRGSRLSAASEALDSFARRWQDRIGTQVLDGPPLEVIEEVVRRAGADLAVVASRGAGATKLVLLGTVATGLLRVLPCDVAIARVPGEFRRP